MKKGFVGRHKILIGVIILALVGGAYYMFRSPGQTAIPRYVIDTVTRGTLVSSISESGQMVVAKQVDLKSKSSGNIKSLLVKAGDKVLADSIVAQLDTTDVEKSLRDAQLNLQSAQLALQKLQQPVDQSAITQATDEYNQAVRALNDLRKPADTLQVTQARNALAQAQRELEQGQTSMVQQNILTQQSIQNNFNDAYTALTTAIIDLDTAFQDLDQMYNGTTTAGDTKDIYEDILGRNSRWLTDFEESYNQVRNSYSIVKSRQLVTNRNGEHEQIYLLLSQTLDGTQIFLEALQAARALFYAINHEDNLEPSTTSFINGFDTKANQAIATINRDSNTLQAAKDKIDEAGQNTPFDQAKSQNTITASEEKVRERQLALDTLLASPDASDIATAQEKVNQKKVALTKLQAGPNELDIKSQELTIQQRLNAVQDAKAKFDDYIVRAPFASMIGELNVHEGDSVSANTTIATLVTEELRAELSLNEIDISDVEIGNPVKLTFSALENILLNGKVSQINPIGTVTQGVVSYTIQVTLNNTDPKIKPGMSVDVAITTDTKPEVLLVPSSAIKSQGNSYYVQVLDAPVNTSQSSTIATNVLPQNQTVVIGATNDTQTEILTGLQEGQQIIVQTLSTNARTTSSTTLRGAGFAGVAR